jgi:hypothetical protein
MCGIAGAVSAGYVEPLVSSRKCKVIDHRGPDGAGFHDGPHATLGMRRLAVIDIATGDQPVREDGGIMAVLIGEMYDFAALRTELEGRGHRFGLAGRSRSRSRSRSRDVDRVLRLLAHPVNSRYGRIASCFTTKQKRALHTDDLRYQIAEHSEWLLAEARRSSSATGTVGQLTKLLREHQTGHDHANRIWALAQMEQRHRHFRPERPVPSDGPLCQGGA